MSYTFEERYPICSKLKMRISKDLLPFVKQHTILSVVMRRVLSTEEYVGTGIVKHVRLVKNSDQFEAIL